MSSDSDFELPDALPVAKGPNLQDLQRKEIEALRAQVLDVASENSILKARMRDIDDIYAKRLSEQVSQQLQQRQNQVLEVEQMKRSLKATEQKNKLLSVEIKTLEAKSRSKPLQAPPISQAAASLMDGFAPKKRRFEQPAAPSQAPKCRSALANLSNKAGSGVLSELTDTDSAKLVGLDSPEAIAQHLSSMNTRPSLALLGVTLGFCRDPVDLSSISDRILGLLNKCRPLPSVYSDGSIVLNKTDVDTLVVTVYSLDVLVNSGYAVPSVVVNSLLKSSNVLFIYYGLLLVENLGTHDSSMVASVPLPELCIELLFGSMWDPEAIDDSILKDWSSECYVLDWPPISLEPLIAYRLDNFVKEYSRQLVRALCATQSEPKATKRVIGLLCLYNDPELEYQCVRFLHRCPGSELPSQVVSRLAQVAASNAKAKALALDLLGRLVSPTEYEQLKGVMEF